MPPLLFPSNPFLKTEILSCPPLFQNLVGGSTPSSRRGVGANYVSQNNFPKVTNGSNVLVEVLFLVLEWI